MAEERYRCFDDLCKLGRREELPELTDSPISYFKWLLARVLTGQDLSIGLEQFENFQVGFPPAEGHFPNLRRHVCLAASALLLERPVGTNPKAALDLTAGALTESVGSAQVALEACGAAACVGDKSALDHWLTQAEATPTPDEDELFEETLFLLGADHPLSHRVCGTSVARICSATLKYKILDSAAPLVIALWHGSGGTSLRELLNGRARDVDESIFGPSGEKVQVKIGKATHELVQSGGGPELHLKVKVTGRGPLAPGGYALAPFTFDTLTLIERIGAKLSRLSEPERKLQIDAFNAALKRVDQGVVFLVEIGRGVELSPADEAGFRERIQHAWSHACRSGRNVHASARVDFERISK
ncbi:MAG: hypothetical protein IPK82_35750 [Polyangiaceae bacterium]|nr:hypothetical protein [Polyangiaceae bacterium]